MGHGIQTLARPTGGSVSKELVTNRRFRVEGSTKWETTQPSGMSATPLGDSIAHVARPIARIPDTPTSVLARTLVRGTDPIYICDPLVEIWRHNSFCSDGPCGALTCANAGFNVDCLRPCRAELARYRSDRW